MKKSYPKIRSKSRIKNWHPSWFVVGARCVNRCGGWRGTVRGFIDSPVAECGVVEIDGGKIIKTPLTYGLDFLDENSP